jgi:hypothetical protein
MKTVDKLRTFKELCKNLKFCKSESITKALKEINTFKLDTKNQLLRGIYLEEALLIKIIEYNKYQAIYRPQGRFSTRNNCFKMRCFVNSTLHRQNFKKNKSRIFPNDYLTINHIYFNPDKRSYLDIPTVKNKIFKAKLRCLAKISIEYCFIDLIIDNTIIDIKTDLNTKSLKKYLRQGFMQSVLFSSFIKNKKEFKDSFTKEDIQSFDIPINSFAIYFWRSNEYFKSSLNDIIQPQDFEKLVDIYTSLQFSHGMTLRNILKGKRN